MNKWEIFVKIFVTGLTTGARGSIILCTVNDSQNGRGLRAALVQLTLLASSSANSNVNVNTLRVEIVPEILAGELPDECRSQCSPMSDTLQGNGTGKRVFVTCGKKVSIYWFLIFLLNNWEFYLIQFSILDLLLLCDFKICKGCEMRWVIVYSAYWSAVSFKWHCTNRPYQRVSHNFVHCFGWNFIES